MKRAIPIDSQDVLRCYQRAKAARQRLAYLYAIERRVIEEEDWDALLEFVPDEPIREIWVPGLITWGRATSVLETSKYSEAEVEETISALKHYFPKAKFRHMADGKGLPIVVVVGVEPKLANAAVALEFTKRKERRILNQCQRALNQEFGRFSDNTANTADTATSGVRSHQDPRPGKESVAPGSHSSQDQEQPLIR